MGAKFSVLKLIPNMTNHAQQKSIQAIRNYFGEISVYRKQAHSTDAAFRMEDEMFNARAGDVDATTRVEDISRGRVALITFADEIEASGYIRLDPDDARALGEALVAAAGYAEEQEGSK